MDDEPQTLTDATAPLEPPPLSTWGRLLAVFTEPERLFGDLARRPRSLLALLVVILVAVGTTQAIHPLVLDMQREAMTANPDLSPQQVEQARQGMRFMEGAFGRVLTGAGALIMSLLTVLVIAAFLLFGGNFLMGGESDFKTLFAVICHVQLVSVVQAVVTVPLMLAKGSMLVSTSLAVLLPPEQWARPMGVLVGGLTDLFTIWMVVLTVVGVSIVYRWNRGKAAGLVVGLYLFGLVVRIVLAALFSGVGT